MPLAQPRRAARSSFAHSRARAAEPRWIPDALDPQRWAFSVKSFGAAMLALFVAMSLDLAQPSWSVTTAYVVSQPLAGMVLSKARYRAVGTIVGAAAGVVLVALFGDSELGFLLVLSLWIAAGAFISAYYRDAPQSYAATLAAFTTVLIGLSAALAPATAFNLAVARTEEILLGIACGAFVHHVIAPRTAGVALHDAIRRATDQVAALTLRVFRDPDGGIDRAELQALITSVFQIDSLRGFALLDTQEARRNDRHLRLLRDRLFGMLALLVSISDRIGYLATHHQTLYRPVARSLEAAAAWIGNARRAAASSRAATDGRPQFSYPSASDIRADQELLFVRSILLRSRDIIATWQDILALDARADVDTRQTAFDEDADLHRFRDFGIATLSAATAFVAVGLACGFWFITAWPSGPTAITFTAVICAIMAPQLAPAKSATTFLVMSIAGAAIAAVYLLLILPRLETFAELIVALAPFYLACGLLLTWPRLLPLAMPMIFNGGALIALSNAQSYEFADFLNSAIAILAGTGLGAVVLLIFHHPYQTRAIDRTIDGLRAELIDLTAVDATTAKRAFESRTFDRINAMLPRIAAEAPSDLAALTASFASLRVGANLIELRDVQLHVGGATRELLQEAQARLHGALSGVTPWPELDAFLTDAERRIVDNSIDATDHPELRAAQALHAVHWTLAQHRLLLQPRHIGGLSR